MRIAIAQMATRAGDFEATCARMEEQAALAAQEQVDLLVFPLATLTGPHAVPGQDREGFMLDLTDAVMELSKKVACPCLVPVVTDMGGTPASEALLLSEGEVRPVRLAAFLEGLAGGSDGTVSRTLPEFQIAGSRLGIAFTYEDLDEYVEYDYNVDTIVYLCSYGFATDDPASALGSAIADSRFRADAEATGAWIVGVGSLGCYDTAVYTGASFVLAPWGELAAQAPAFEEALVVCDVEPHAEGPLDDPAVPQVFDAALVTWGALSLGVRSICERAGVTDACVLLDGSVQSCVTVALAVDALGPTNVHALVWEGAGAAETAVSRALVRSLRVDERTLPAEPVASSELARDLAEAHLAAFAREVGGICLGSTDKTALAVERPAGTSAATVLPLGDLYRSDVVALAHLRNTISPVIPQDAFVSLPADGLERVHEAFATEEARIQFVDLVLSAYVEWERCVSDIVEARGNSEAVEQVIGRLRDLEPVRARRGSSIIVSSKTLEEAKAPGGLAWRDRVRSEEERADDTDGLPLPDQRRAFARDSGPAAQAPRPDARERDREVREMLGFLQDFASGGALWEPGTPAKGITENPGGTAPDAGWRSPFSEN